MDWALFATFLAACAAAAGTGAAFEPGGWYDALKKPSWNPPKWLFPLAWMVLYFLMSFAAMRVAMLPGSGQALAFWAAQIAFNTLWTPVFFGLNRMRAGLFVIVCLWIFVAGCVVSFWALDALAGALMVPYLMWVSVAGALNFAVMRLNPEVRG